MRRRTISTGSSTISTGVSNFFTDISERVWAPFSQGHVFYTHSLSGRRLFENHGPGRIFHGKFTKNHGPGDNFHRPLRQLHKECGVVTFKPGRLHHRAAASCSCFSKNFPSASKRSRAGVVIFWKHLCQTGVTKAQHRFESHMAKPKLQQLASKKVWGGISSRRKTECPQDCPDTHPPDRPDTWKNTQKSENEAQETQRKPRSTQRKHKRCKAHPKSQTETPVFLPGSANSLRKTHGRN